MADLKFISKSDLEILKALTSANAINKKYSSNSVQNGSDVQITVSSDEFNSGGAYSTSSFSSTSDDLISAYNSFKFDSEYEIVRGDVNCIILMCDMFVEKNKELEMHIYSFIKDMSSTIQEMISTEHLGELLEQLDNTVEHIVLICDKMYRIQQVLQEKPFERTLKVNPSCQKAVMKFFTVAKEIMNKLQQQIGYIENYRCKNAAGLETHHKELQSRLHNKILELAKRIDIVTQFRERMTPPSNQNSCSTSKLDLLLS